MFRGGGGANFDFTIVVPSIINSSGSGGKYGKNVSEFLMHILVVD